MYHDQANERRCAPRRVPRAVTATLMLLLTGALIAPSAMAQDLDSMRADLASVKKQQVSAQSEIAEASTALDSATGKLVSSQNALANAQANLADVQVSLSAARELDASLATELKVAQAALEVARVEVAQGEANLAAQLKLMGEVARDAFQQQNPLEGLDVVLGSESTSEMSQRLQWNTTIFDRQAGQKSRLDVVQAALNAARDRQAEFEATVADKKQESARQVGIIQGLERQARDQAAAVSALVAANQQVRAAAQAELDADQSAYNQLRAQEDGIAHEIQSELARLKAEAERRAREEAARVAAAKAAAANASRPTTSVPKAPAASGSSSGTSASDPTGYGVSRYGFIRPIAAKNGSPFGLRFHPILHYWRMHNGTDFGAATGTPLYAAADGVVLKAGPNGGFGNFVLIGHNAEIGGRYVTTGYAHQSRVAVRVGQRVTRGQLIGYVGNTGLSTTAHLHFEVRLNGTPVNPMLYIP